MLRWETDVETVGHDGFKFNEKFRVESNEPEVDYTTWAPADVRHKADQIMRTTAAADEARESDAGHEAVRRRIHVRS